MLYICTLNKEFIFKNMLIYIKKEYMKKYSVDLKSKIDLSQTICSFLPKVREVLITLAKALYK